MIVTTLVALVILLGGYLKQGNVVLIAADLLLFALSGGVVVLFLKTFLKKRSGEAPA